MSKGVADTTSGHSCIRGCAGDFILPHMYEQGDALHLHKQKEILFSVNGKYGYPLEDAFGEQYVGLDGWSDWVFVEQYVGPDGWSDWVFVDLESTINLKLKVCPSASARSDGGLKSCSQWLPYEELEVQVGANPLLSLYGR